MKNKWLAAALNIVPGIGYLYGGTRVPFGVLLLMIWPISIIGATIDPTWVESGAELPWMTMDWITLAAAEIPFIVDAYLEVERNNAAHARAAKKA